MGIPKTYCFCAQIDFIFAFELQHCESQRADTFLHHPWSLQDAFSQNISFDDSQNGVIFHVENRSRMKGPPQSSQTVALPGTESTHTAVSTFTVPRLSNSFCFVLLVFFLLLVFLCLSLCLFLVLLLFCCNQEFKIISCQLPGCLRNKAQDAVLTKKTMEEAQA